jgi:putative ABC transport system permease protein
LVQKTLVAAPEFAANVPEWKALDEFGDSMYTRAIWGVLYFTFYLRFAASPWLFLLLPVHFLIGVFHGAIVNWCGHRYGYRNFSIGDKSRNTLPVDFLMMGELYQNNHHRYPKRLQFAVLLSVTLSFFLISTLRTLLEKLEVPSPMPNSARRAVVRHASSLGLTLPISYRDRIGKVPGVGAVSAAQWFGGVYRNPANFFPQYAVDAEAFFDVYPETHAESPEQEHRFIRDRTAGLAGTLLKERFGWKIGDRITLKGVALPVDIETTIAGFVTGGGNDGNYYFHTDYLNELFPQNATQTVFLIANKSADLSAISEAVDGMFANSPAPTRTEAESVFIVRLMSMWGNVGLLVNAVSTAVLFTLILIAANTMAMSIRERTPEIALLRTLGFTPRAVVAILIAESSMICVAGGLLGSLGSLLLSATLDIHSLTSGVIQNFQVRWQTVLFAVSISLIAAIVSTLVPAFNASRACIAASLRP